MIRRLIILLLIVGCGTEPEEGCLYDCEGVCNGEARKDCNGDCGTAIQEWNATSLLSHSALVFVV